MIYEKNIKSMIYLCSSYFLYLQFKFSLSLFLFLSLSLSLSLVPSRINIFEDINFLDKNIMKTLTFSKKIC